MFKALGLTVLLMSTGFCDGIYLPSHSLSIELTGQSSLKSVKYNGNVKKDFYFARGESPAMFSSRTDAPFLILKCENVGDVTQKKLQAVYYPNGYSALCTKDKCSVKINYIDSSTVPNDYDKQLKEAQDSKVCREYAPVKYRTLEFDVKLAESLEKELEGQSKVLLSYTKK